MCRERERERDKEILIASGYKETNMERVTDPKRRFQVISATGKCQRSDVAPITTECASWSGKKKKIRARGAVVIDHFCARYTPGAQTWRGGARGTKRRGGFNMCLGARSRM